MKPMITLVSARSTKHLECGCCDKPAVKSLCFGKQVSKQQASQLVVPLCESCMLRAAKLLLNEVG